MDGWNDNIKINFLDKIFNKIELYYAYMYDRYAYIYETDHTCKWRDGQKL